MNFLDPDVLTRTVREAGLEMEEAVLFSRPEFVGAMKLDGRELVGFVARKPDSTSPGSTAGGSPTCP